MIIKDRPNILQPFFSIFDTISGSPDNYTVTYANSTFNNYCGLSIVEPENDCEEGVCTDVFEVASSYCSPSTDIDVTIFATNILGNGSRSKEASVGMIFHFDLYFTIHVFV